MPDHSTFPDREKHKQFDQEIREMISSLTNRLTTLHHPHKVGDSSEKNREEEDGQATRIITLAGSNAGASMRGEMDDKQGLEGEESEAIKAYVNSNFQAINNSIMLGGSYSTNDPGVHMEVVDNTEPREKHPKRKSKGKKKEKESSSSSDDEKKRHSD